MRKVAGGRVKRIFRTHWASFRLRPRVATRALRSRPTASEVLQARASLATHWSSVDGILRAYRDPSALRWRTSRTSTSPVCRQTTRSTSPPEARTRQRWRRSSSAFSAPSATLCSRRGWHTTSRRCFGHWTRWQISRRSPDLDNILSVAGGQHLLILGAIAGPQPGPAKGGQEAEGFLTLFHNKLVLNGIADMDTLQRLSRLAGEKEDREDIDEHERAGRPRKRRNAERASEPSRRRLGQSWRGRRVAFRAERGGLKEEVGSGSRPYLPHEPVARHGDWRRRTHAGA